MWAGPLLSCLLSPPPLCSCSCSPALLSTPSPFAPLPALLPEGGPLRSALEVQQGSRVSTASALPVQLHWHTPSEHLLQGTCLHMHVCMRIHVHVHVLVHAVLCFQPAARYCTVVFTDVALAGVVDLSQHAFTPGQVVHGLSLVSLNPANNLNPAGRSFPLEAHLVSVVPPDMAQALGCPSWGCLVVTAVLYELEDESSTSTSTGTKDSSSGTAASSIGSALLDAVFSAVPGTEGAAVTLPAGLVLDLDALLPVDRSYVSYTGSLTAPPCHEGVLWAVLTTPLRLSMAQWRAVMSAVGAYNCTAAAPGTQPDRLPPTEQANASSANRRLLHGGSSRHTLQANSTESSAPAVHVEQAPLAHNASLHGCTKLRSAGNARLPQPLHDRTLRVWREPPAGHKGLLPADAVSAASAGVIAGIVLGVTLGAGLTALVGLAVYRSYRRHRMRKLYRMGAGLGSDLAAVSYEVEAESATLMAGGTKSSKG